MKEVLDKCEKEKTWNSSENEGCYVEGLPGRNAIEHHKVVQEGDNCDAVPLIMSKEFHEISLKHSRWGFKEPMWRIYNFNVTLVIKIPNLLQKRSSGIDNPRNFFLKTSNGHGIGESESQWMMELHFLPNIFEITILQKTWSSRVMRSKSRDIQYIIVLNQQYFIGLLSITLHLLVTIEL